MGTLKRKYTKKAVAPVVHTSDFCVSLVCGDKTLEGTGATIVDAFRALPRPIETFWQKGILSVTANDKKFEKFLFANQVRQLVRFDIFRMRWAKKFAYNL